MSHTIVPVPLPDNTLQVLTGAARRLARILGPRVAPDVVRLIQHELTGRSVRGLVDEYLDALGRSPPVRLAPRSALRAARRVPRTPRRCGGALRRSRPPLDPTRN